MKCEQCGKELSADMEIEYSGWATSYFCHPDCALSFYFAYMDSRPLAEEEIEELLSRKE